MKYIQTLLLGCTLLGSTSLQSAGESLYSKIGTMISPLYSRRIETDLAALQKRKARTVVPDAYYSDSRSKLPLSSLPLSSPLSASSPLNIPFLDRSFELAGLTSENARVIRATALFSLVSRGIPTLLLVPQNLKYTYQQGSLMAQGLPMLAPALTLRQVYRKLTHADTLAAYKKQLDKKEKDALHTKRNWLAALLVGHTYPARMLANKAQNHYASMGMKAIYLIYAYYLWKTENDLLEKALAWKAAQKEQNK